MRGAVVAWLLLSLTLLTTSGLAGEEAHDLDAGFLFSYDIRPGMQALFEEGYRRHLDWHRQAGDPLCWYGWTVATGSHLGRFVDGTFGLSFEDFDQRVDLAGDRADATVNLSPYVEPVSRMVLRRRPELGTGSPLEDGTTAPLLEVSTYRVHAGEENRFEEAARAWRDALRTQPQLPAVAWYEVLSGGERPSYVLVVPRRSWGDHGLRFPRLEIADSVEGVWTETWSYRAELSSFPSGGGCWQSSPPGS